MMEGTYTAVIDRIVEGTAVLLVEDDGEVVDELHVDARDVPDEAGGEGAVLTVRLSEGDVRSLRYREDETEDREKRLRDRFDRLSTRLGDDAQSDDDDVRSRGDDSRSDDGSSRSDDGS